MMKDRKLYRKVKLFCNSRLLPILLLWGSGLLACEGLVGALTLIVQGEPPHLELMDFSSLGDTRPVLLLALAVLVIMAFMFVVKANTDSAAVNQTSMVRALRSLWDEVSSASTHAGAALFASIYWPFVAELSPKAVADRMLMVLLLVSVGFAFFNDGSTDTAAPKPWKLN